MADVYIQVFGTENLQKFRGPLIKFKFQNDVQPRFYEKRQVPCALCSQIEDEIDSL